MRRGSWLQGTYGRLYKAPTFLASCISGRVLSLTYSSSNSEEFVSKGGRSLLKPDERVHYRGNATYTQTTQAKLDQFGRLVVWRIRVTSECSTASALEHIYRSISFLFLFSYFYEIFRVTREVCLFQVARENDPPLSVFIFAQKSGEDTTE